MRPIFPTTLILPLLALPVGRAAEVTVEPKPFVIERSLTATALPMSPVSLKLDTDGWPSFEIRKIAAHGSRVAAGEVLVEFDTEALDRKIEDGRKALDSATLAFAQAENDLKSLKDNAPIKFDAAKRAARNSADDLAYFTQTSRKAQEEGAAQKLKRSKEQLANAKEELRQLEKMYKADDLVEETEEIILVRQRDAVAAAEFGLRMAEMDNKRTLDTTLPHLAEDYDAAARSTALALPKTEADVPRQIQQKEIEVTNSRTALARQKEDFQKLTEARKLADPVKASGPGLFYHGAIEDGRWAVGEAVKGSLVAHTLVPARRAYATFIPDGSPLGLVAFTEEGVARSLPRAATGIGSLPGREDLLVTATVKSVSETPGTDGRFRVDLAAVWPSAAPGDAFSPPEPGNSLQVRLISYENPTAIVLPATALKVGKDGWSVNVKLADGKSAPRPVKRGRASGEQVEILSGLEPGQVVITP